MSAPAEAASAPDEAAASHEVAAAEVDSLLREPPDWLEPSLCDPGLERLDATTQRGKGPRASRFVWQWECAIRAPADSPYAGAPYRLIVRFPVAYPRLPPRLQLLSIVAHADVETRDPYEGRLEPTFYDALAAAISPDAPAGGAATHSSALRFAVGDRVACRVGADEWSPGEVTQLWYTEPHWEEGRVAPYQVELDDGRRIFAPADDARLIRAETAGVAAAVGAGGASAAGEDGRAEGSDGARVAPPVFTVAAALELLRRAFSGPIEAGHEAAAVWEHMAERHAKQLRIERAYRPECLHPSLFDPATAWSDACFAPSFVRPFRTGGGPPSAASLRALASQPAAGIYVFDMLSDQFCDDLLAELQNYEAAGHPVSRPNSMNRYGLILNNIGLEQSIDALQRRYLRPLAEALFGAQGRKLDHHHTFMVQYRASEDLGLDMHTDACDVTLNVCLGKTFSGAGLTFCGVRGADDSDERKFTHRHEHVKGRAVMHLGHQRHGADDIAGGERYNLIIWSKSSTWRLGREFYAKYNARPSDRGPPDPVCLSYTHDRDYEDYKDYPPGKRPKAESGG